MLGSGLELNLEFSHCKISLHDTNVRNLSLLVFETLSTTSLIARLIVHNEKFP